VAVDTLEITVLIAFWAFTIWRFITPQSARGKAVRLTALLVTLSVTFNRREISFATDQILHVPDISVPLKNLATVAASAGMVHIVGIMSTTPSTGARLRRWVYALLAATGATMIILFILVPRSPARGDFVAEHAGTPLVTAYGVLAQLGLAVGLLCCLVLFRPAARRAEPGLLRTGLHLLSAGAVVGLLFMANRVLFQVSHAMGSTALDGTPAMNVSRSLLGGMLLLFAAGISLPALSGLRRWTSRYLALQRLRPFWLTVTTAVPSVVLGDPPTRLEDLLAVRSVQLRLYRRIIEIRDAQWHLTNTQSPTATLDPASTGSPAAAGPAAADSASPAPSGTAWSAFAGPAAPTATRADMDIDDQVRTLLAAWRSSPPRAARSVVATPVGAPSHNVPSDTPR